MSLYQKASLVQIPSGYKAADDKLYSVVPSNGNGDFTIDSDADATRVNKDGLIESVVADQARLNYDPSNPQDPHLLLEPTRRNIVDYSQEFNQWTLASGASVTTNQITSPDGSNTSDKITSSATNSRVNRTFTYSNNSTMVFSVFIKNIDATNIKIGISDNVTGVCYATFTFSTETITAANQGSWTNTSASVVDFGNGWYRLILISTKGAGSNLSPRIEFTESGKNIFAWGAQLEDDGSFGSVDYPTSYIPTSGLAVTRTVDYASGAGNEALFNDSEGTLFIEAAALGNDNTYRVINISDGTTANRVLIQLGNNNNQIRADVVATTTQASFSTTSYNFTNYNKIALKYKDNDTALFINGVQIGSTATGKTMPTGLDRIDFQNGNLGSTFYFRGKLKQLMYFDTALTDAELITLTS